MAHAKLMISGQDTLDTLLGAITILERTDRGAKGDDTNYASTRPVIEAIDRD
jgi:hypothetical protein